MHGNVYRTISCNSFTTIGMVSGIPFFYYFLYLCGRIIQAKVIWRLSGLQCLFFNCPAAGSAGENSCLTGYGSGRKPESAHFTLHVTGQLPECRMVWTLLFILCIGAVMFIIQAAV